MIRAPRQRVWQAITEPAHPGITLHNSFLLEKADGNTRVTVSQAEYESLPEGMRQDADAYTAIVESLKSYLER